MTTTGISLPLYFLNAIKRAQSKGRFRDKSRSWIIREALSEALKDKELTKMWDMSKALREDDL